MKIALVGNQNSGKTSLFNLLTGTNQKVGNWPGVTIERKIGTIKNTNHEVVDLPGIYSLSPYTTEEEVSRKFVLEDKPDLIINIIDATCIERSLYLTTQLLELDCPVIIALNMCDMLEKKGIDIDTSILSDNLKTTIIKISALKRSGIDTLIQIINNRTYLPNIHNEIYPNDIEKCLNKIILNLNCDNKRFIAVKMLEDDPSFKTNDEYILNERKQIEQKYKYDIEQIIANERYNYIIDVKQKSVKVKSKGESITDKLDKIFLNKWLAIPIFICIMALVYFLAVSPYVGGALSDIIDSLFQKLSSSLETLLTNIGASYWIVSLICNGILAGISAVLSFVPQLIILFLCISLLETSGYMSRIAFFLDKVFRKFGLSGKSLIPFIVGSGCSVPGIMSTRTVEDETERRMTIMLTPFIPCSAKLPIIILFATNFFTKAVPWITISVYFLSIVIILLSAIVMKKFFFKSSSSVFISELPEYKLPSPRYVLRDVFDKSVAFIKRAGTIILLCSVIVWLLLSFSWKMEYTDSPWQVIDDISIESLAEEVGYDSFNVTDNNVQAKYENNLYLRFKDGEWSEWYIYPLTLEKYFNGNQDQRKEIVVKIDDKKIEAKYSLGIDNSILASIGKAFSWIFYPILGERNWGATVSAVQGLVAKEQVVSSMSVIAGLADNVSDSDAIFSSKIFSNMTPLSSYAFMVFNLFSAPCFGAIGAMYKELGSKKKLLIAISFQTGLAWILGSLIFGIGSLILKVI